MNITIIYTSKYGSTRQYAQWLKEAIPSAQLYEHKEIHPQDLVDCDILLYGGSLHAGGIRGISLLKKQATRLKGKKLILFVVGATPPSSISMDEIQSKNAIPGLEDVEWFYLHGNMDVANMEFLDKNLMKMLRKMLIKKAPEDLADWEAALLKNFDGKEDHLDRSAIVPIVEAVPLIHEAAAPDGIDAG